jgi:hypothetical protein
MKNIESSQRHFYLNKFQKFGDDPKSLSWNDEDSQFLRFMKISELFKYETELPFSVHEVGCGLGHFKDYLDKKKWDIIYSGSDIVLEFIEKNREKYPSCTFSHVSIVDDTVLINNEIKGSDYYCLSGTFHTKEDNPTVQWESFIFKSIKNMFQLAKKGICISFLSSYSDYYDPNLYYGDPKTIFDWSVIHCSRYISINHDIPLYEFFVYIYKEEFIKQIFPEYQRYYKC